MEQYPTISEVIATLGFVESRTSCIPDYRKHSHVEVKQSIYRLLFYLLSSAILTWNYRLLF